MKVTEINKYKDAFKAHLLAKGDLQNKFYFDLIDNWQAHWNGEAKNLSQVYDQSLQSEVSARLWGGSTDSPKSTLIMLINANEDFMRATFRDLFNEKLDLGLRLDRFGYHADQILRPLQGKNPKLVSHMHNDRSLLCLYLALQYPDFYCLFDYPAFNAMMTKFESRNIPTKVEQERYYKSCRGIFNLIKKDEELMALLQKITGREELGLMVMSLFMEFVANS